MPEPTTTITDPATQTPSTQPAAEPATPKTFDDFLAENKDWQSEFDRRTQKALTTAKTGWDSEQKVIIDARDKDLSDLQEKMKNFEGTQAEFDTLKTKYADEAKLWADKEKAQAYEFAVKSSAGEIEFTSKAAKSYFIDQAVKAGMKMAEDGSILGFTDFVKQYKTNDPTAIKVAEEPAPNTKPAPTFVAPTSTAPQADANPFTFKFAGVRPIKK